MGFKFKKKIRVEFAVWTILWPDVLEDRSYLVHLMLAPFPVGVCKSARQDRSSARHHSARLWAGDIQVSCFR